MPPTPRAERRYAMLPSDTMPRAPAEMLMRVAESFTRRLFMRALMPRRTIRAPDAASARYAV